MGPGILDVKMSLGSAVILLLLPASIFPAEDVAVIADFVNLSFTANGTSRTAALYVPPGYRESRTWPLIVYLHGGGGTGDNNGNAINEWMNRQPIVRAIQKNPERFQALVLIPRCPEGRIWTPVPPNPVQSEWRLRRHGREPAPDAMMHITSAINATMKSYSVDSDRVTLTGSSMGGEGATRYAALQADRIAGVAPSAGSAMIVPEDAPALARMGVWIFQGQTDSISTATLARRMTAAIRAAGGTVRYTEYEGVGHGIANRNYGDEQVIDWLLKQTRRSNRTVPMPQSLDIK